MSNNEILPVAVDNKIERVPSPTITTRAMEPKPQDKVSVAPNVLLTMVRLGALSIEGVVRMGNTPGGVNAWLRRTPAERGVQLQLDGQSTVVDAYIVVNADSDLREVCRRVQNQVARDIEENVGMHVGAVNVHIEDVVFQP